MDKAPSSSNVTPLSMQSLMTRNCPLLIAIDEKIDMTFTDGHRPD